MVVSGSLVVAVLSLDRLETVFPKLVVVSVTIGPGCVLESDGDHFQLIPILGLLSFGPGN